MTPFPNFLPLPGQASTATDLAGQLGNIYIGADGKIYRLVKAGATIATAASLGLKVGITAGVHDWTVTVPSAATTADVVFVPAGQVGSTGTTSLISGDYFMAQVSGGCTFLAANTTLVLSDTQVLQVNTTGYVAALTSTTVEASSCLRATNSAAASAAGVAITGYIAGLI